MAERVERARIEPMSLRSLDPGVLWTDYVVSSRSPLTSPRKKPAGAAASTSTTRPAAKTRPAAVSPRDYRVALRGWAPGESYCSCPDFRTNTLGTCKHVLFALTRVRRRFRPSVRAVPYVSDRIVVSLRYGPEVELRLLVPPGLPAAGLRRLRPFLDRPIPDAEVPRLLEALAGFAQIKSASPAASLGFLLAASAAREATPPLRIHPDAAEYIRRVLFRCEIGGLVAAIRRDPAGHPLRRTLLKRELLPYQLDGIAFAVGVGRAVLADDMGLGKTIQGIGTAELLARQAGITRVLVVCPASLKAHWRSEIAAASGRSCRLVWGPLSERLAGYAEGAFFTVCNYEQVMHDLRHIEAAGWDLIILDEGQRIKNWKARTSRAIKALRSPFALVLSGTPLENRLEELYSVVQFADARRLGPMFLFHDRHRDADADGKALGYKNLGELRERLRPILLRRTRADVRMDLPPRTTEIRRVPASRAQLDIEAEQRVVIGRILAKKFLTEDDLLRIQRCLLLCRLASDSAFLVEKIPPARSSKLDELGELLDALLSANGRKIVLFSEWTKMLDLIEPILRRLKAGYVRLDGSVAQKKRQALIDSFLDDPSRRLFLATNAGSVGLNLQAADTVVNVDLPWNPAVLEQRISRVHRMGQKKPVQAYLLVTEGMIEEGMLATLQVKRDLASAALDPDSGVDIVRLRGGVEAMKDRVRGLIEWKPETAAIPQAGGGEVKADIDPPRKPAGRESEGRGRRSGDRPRTSSDGSAPPSAPASDAPIQAAGRLMGAMFEFMRALDPGLSAPDEAALNDLAGALARAFQKGVRS